MKIMNTDARVSVPRLVMVLIFIYVIISPIIHALKVTRISYEIGAYVFYIGLPVITLMIWVTLFRARHHVPSLAFFFLLVSFMFAMLISIFYGGDWFDMAGNFVRLLFCLGMLQFASVYRQAIIAFLTKNDKKIAIFSMLSMSLAVGGLYLSSFIGVGVYFGLQSTVAFVSLSYGLVYRNFLFSVVSLMLIVLSGKRGAMLAAVAILLMYLFVLLYSGEIRRFFVIFCGIVFVSLGAFFSGLVPESILSRFEQFTSGEPTDWNKATAGRMTEINSVIEIVTRNPEVLVHGLGLGAAIKDPSGASDSTIHFSPFGLMLIWGLPLTILFYIPLIFYFALGVYMSGKKFFRHKEKVFFWNLIFIGELAFSFSAFTILQSMMLWLSLAAIIALTMDRPASVHGRAHLAPLKL